MQQAETFDELYRQIRLRKVPFLVTFAVIVLVSYAFLYIIDLIPEPIEESINAEESAVVPAEDSVALEAATPVVVEEPTVPAVVTSDTLPRKIIIDALNREVPVLNPTSRAIPDLDEALLSGVVRHPDSADFGADGNVFILGHSSYLPTVFNKNFQAFNGLQDLEWGDTIRVQSSDTEYIYRVQDVYQAKASDVFVPNTPGEARLTLATCNTFGSKEDRFIVEAILIERKAL